MIRMSVACAAMSVCSCLLALTPGGARAEAIASSIVEPGEGKPEKGKTKPGKKSKRRSGKKRKKSRHVFPKGSREEFFVEKLGDRYRIRRTDHFFVIHNADDQIVKDFVLRIEQTYKSVHRFADKLGIKIEYPPEKLPIVFCDDRDEFEKRCKRVAGRPAPGGAAGLYYRGPNCSIFYDVTTAGWMRDRTEQAHRWIEQAEKTKDAKTRRRLLRRARVNLNQVESRRKGANQSTVQHEVAHQLLYNLRVHNWETGNPKWLVEGLATLFETPPGQRGAGFGVINQRRLGGIRPSMPRMRPEGLKTIVGKPVSLNSKSYAQAWALAYYIVKQKSEALPAYIDLIQRRERGKQTTFEQEVADFEKCFGTINERFVKRWKNFIMKLPHYSE